MSRTLATAERAEEGPRFAERRGAFRVWYALPCVVAWLLGCAASDPPAPPANDQPPSEASEFTDPHEASDPAVDFGHYTALEPSQVRPLALRTVLTIDLGRDPTNTPADVTDIALRADSIFLLDGSAHKIRGYDRSGRSLFVTGKWGTREGEMTFPIRLAVDGDTLLLLDVTHPDGFNAYDRAGHFLGPRLRDFTDGGNVSLGIRGDTFYVTALPVDTSARSPYVLRALTRSGKLIARGCWRDPVYVESERRHGHLRSFGFSNLAIADDVIYCVQPLSPIVQVLNTAARLTQVIAVAPPFYAAPHDTAAFTNDRALRHFESTFTEHSRIFARHGGFVSVYRRFDDLQGQAEFHLFACARPSSDAIHCAAAVSPGAPVHLIEPDTLVVSQPATNAHGPRLVFLTLR